MAKVKKQELGKGIRALLGPNPDAEPPKKDKQVEEKVGGINWIALTYIEINPFQPRNEFDQEALDELAESIKTFGLIQPITVRKLDGSKYQLISGERRFRASKLAELDSVPAFVREANDQEMLEMALVENIQREELNPIEVAISYQRLIDECDLTHDALSDRIGKNRSTVTNYIRLLKLPPALQQALKQSRISMGHARALLGIPTQEGQMIALQRVLLDDLSVRATEKLVRDYTGGSSKKTAKKSTLSPEYQQVVDHLSQTLGTRVQLKRKSSGAGTLVIKFGSDDELNAILDAMEGN